MNIEQLKKIVDEKATYKISLFPKNYDFECLIFELLRINNIDLNVNIKKSEINGVVEMWNKYCEFAFQKVDKYKKEYENNKRKELKLKKANEKSLA
jgi:hypothetical protein